MSARTHGKRLTVALLSCAAATCLVIAAEQAIAFRGGGFGGFRGGGFGGGFGGFHDGGFGGGARFGDGGLFDRGADAGFGRGGWGIRPV